MRKRGSHAAPVRPPALTRTGRGPRLPRTPPLTRPPAARCPAARGRPAGPLPARPRTARATGRPGTARLSTGRRTGTVRRGPGRRGTAWPATARWATAHWVTTRVSRRSAVITSTARPPPSAAPGPPPRAPGSRRSPPRGSPGHPARPSRPPARLRRAPHHPPSSPSAAPPPGPLRRPPTRRRRSRPGQASRILGSRPRPSRGRLPGGHPAGAWSLPPGRCRWWRSHRPRWKRRCRMTPCAGRFAGPATHERAAAGAVQLDCATARPGAGGPAIPGQPGRRGSDAG